MMTELNFILMREFEKVEFEDNLKRSRNEKEIIYSQLWIPLYFQHKLLQYQYYASLTRRTFL